VAKEHSYVLLYQATNGLGGNQLQRFGYTLSYFNLVKKWFLKQLIHFALVSHEKHFDLVWDTNSTERLLSTSSYLFD